MRIAIAILVLVLPAASQDVFDLLLKNGHVIDPGNGRSQRLDIAVKGQRIARIAVGIPVAQARKVIDLSDYYVTPGLIDLHASVAPRVTPNGVDPDHNTLRYGVTTVVDAGSSGSATFDQFRKNVIDNAAVRVLAFLNIEPAGSFPVSAAIKPDPFSAAKVIKQNPQIIVGIAADATHQAIARKAAETAGTILMVGTTDTPARPGDIVTGIYRPNERTVSQLDAARGKGVLFDSGALWFRVAVPAIKQGLLPDVISSAMDAASATLPRATLTSAMSKFLAMGLTLEQVIDRTTAKPAKAIRRTDIGSLTEGGFADIAVFRVAKGRFHYLDSGRARLTADTRLRCVLTIRNGEVVWDTEGLSLTDWESAGPYSNFK